MAGKTEWYHARFSGQFHFPEFTRAFERKGVVSVKVEMTAESFQYRMEVPQELIDKVDHASQGITGLRMSIEPVSPNSLEHFAGKARRVIDLRGEI